MARKPSEVFHPYMKNKILLLPHGYYDILEFKPFEDALDGLCLGTGIKRIPIFVGRYDPSDPQMPLAYVADLGRETMDEKMRSFFPLAIPAVWHVERHMKKPAIIITEPLLSAGLIMQEIEAVVAVLIAKVILNPLEGVKTIVADFGNAWVRRQARKLGLDNDTFEQARETFTPGITLGTCNNGALATLLQDAWAARLTGQPQAIESAISKSCKLLQNTPARLDLADNFVFVDPPHQWEYPLNMVGSNDGYGYRNDFHQDMYWRQDMGSRRDDIIRLRLESLEKIKKGMRQPHMEVRDAKPTITPEGWK